MGEERTGIVRHIVDEDGARAAFRAIASDLGAGEAELVAQRHRQRFLWHDVDAAILAVYVQRDQTLDAARTRWLPVQRRRAEQIGRRGCDSARRDDTLDEPAARP